MPTIHQIDNQTLASDAAPADTERTMRPTLDRAGRVAELATASGEQTRENWAIFRRICRLIATNTANSRTMVNPSKGVVRASLKLLFPAGMPRGAFSIRSTFV